MLKNIYSIDNYDLLKLYLSDQLMRQSSIAGMGEIVVSSQEKPIVGTFGLATCTGIIFYDRKNKKAWVGHGLASHSINTLIKMLNEVKDVTGDLEYSIILGWDNNRDIEKYNELFNILVARCSKQIRLVPLVGLDVQTDYGSGNPSYEFAFNATTGESVTRELFYHESQLNDENILNKLL